MKSVLFLSYYFPPAGGAGVFRALKFAKYLGRAGWRIFIVAGNPSEQRFSDPSLLHELPDNVLVYHTTGFSPFYHFPFIRKKLQKRLHIRESDFFFIPDNKIWWRYDAEKICEKLLKENNIDLIFATLPPFSVSFVAFSFGKKYQIPYILDFRDSWTNNPMRPKLPPIHRRINERMAKKVIDGSSAVVVYSPEIALDLEKLICPKEKMKLIMGGYDDEDFSIINPVQKEDKNKIVITSVGTIYDGLEDCLYLFLDALASIAGKIPPFELRLCGGMPASIKNKLDELKLAGQVKILGYLPHIDALRELVSADYLLLIGRPIEYGERMFYSQVYEYIRADKPIFAVLPPFGSMAKLLRETGKTIFVPTGSPKRAGEIILEFMRKGEYSEPKFSIEQYSRQNMAKELERIFQMVLG